MMKSFKTGAAGGTYKKYKTGIIAEQFVNNKGLCSGYSGSVLHNPEFITVPSKTPLKFKHPRSA